MGKILSVVIPTYNMEKYLGNCLDSFIYDEKASDLEILVVNDGSKDNSLNIARNYEQRYPNIFKVIDKENGGHGSTINAGLKVATGKYFKVVDSDDWVDTEELKKLLKFLYETEVDCVVSNFVYFYEHINKYKLDKCEIAEPFKVLNIEDVDNFRFAMHSFVFKTETIKDVRLQEKCFYVDVEYNLYSYYNCKTCVYLPIDLYQYRLGRAGQSVSIEGLYKHRDNHFTVVNNIVRFYNSNVNNSEIGQSKQMFNYIKHIITLHYVYHNLMSMNHHEVLKELKEFDEWLKQYKNFYDAVKDNKIIRKLRNNNFQKLKGFTLIYKIKQIVKRVLRRA